MTDELSEILEAVNAGDAQAAERLLPLVYEKMHAIAHQQMRGEAPGHSLFTTELVHEAYLKLGGPDHGGRVDWAGQGHYLSAAAQAMRCILVDRARARGALKRGGNQRRLELSDLSQLSLEEVPLEMLDLDEALTRFQAMEPIKAELVSLKFFSGLTLKEAAEVLDLPKSTADRYWAFARAWLQAAMRGEL